MQKHILSMLALGSFAGAVHAIETYTALQLADGFRKYPIDEHGKLRQNHFEIAALTVQGDDGSLYRLCKMPPGRVRVIPCLSRISTSAYGASRTLDIGHNAYNKRSDYGEAQEAVNYEAFVANMDISSAVNAAAWSTVLEYDIYSVAGWELWARVQGGTSDTTETLKGFVTFLYE
jgi:hypothetical protein